MQVDYDPLNDVDMMHTENAGCNMVVSIVDPVEKISVVTEVEIKAEVAECQMVSISNNSQTIKEVIAETQSDKTMKTIDTPKQDAWNRVTTYLAENEVKKALEAELQQKMVEKILQQNRVTLGEDIVETFNAEPKEIMVDGQKLDCVFDDEPLGFRKIPML